MLRINLLETRVRSTLADIDAWRAASGKQVRVRGLKRGPYARLYLSLDHEPFPADLIDLLCIILLQQRILSDIVTELRAALIGE